MTITEVDKIAHREAVAVRVTVMDMTARRNVARVKPNGVASNQYQAKRFDAILKSPQSRERKILALWSWADEAAREIAPVTACRRKCSDCCHIAVLVPKPEAELIAKRTRRKLASPTVQRGGKPSKRAPEVGRGYEDIPWGYSSPCSFLKNGRCSIYADRPMTCRTHYNFDADQLLCKLTDAPNTNPVPYGDTRLSMRALAEACDPHAQVADIREWFPVD